MARVTSPLLQLRAGEGYGALHNIVHNVRYA